MEDRKKQTRTVQEEMARERKFWRQNQLWALLLFGAVILFGLFGGSGVSVAPGPEELVLTLQDGQTISVAYGQISAIEMLEHPVYGEMVEGTEGRDGKSGTWKSAVWGEYTLCVYASCDQAVRIVTEGRSYVVNLASEAETRQLYAIVLDKSPVSR